MSAPVDPIPEGRLGVIPYIAVAGGVAAIDFYKKAFGAIELFTMQEPGGRVGHANC